MDPKLTLSYEEFEKLAKKLVKRSEELGDGWELRKSSSGLQSQGVVNKGPFHYYLVKKCTLLTRKRRAEEEPAEDKMVDELAGDVSGLAEEEKADVASLDKSREENGRDGERLLVHAEYHIVHSISYQVPVLYFTVAYSNGQALTLEQVWEILTPDYVSHAGDKWGVVTQQEHPYLGRPFFHIHPCHTATVVGKAMQCASFPDDDAPINGDSRDTPLPASNGKATPPSGVNYLVTWLSTFAPVVGLEFSLKYAQ